MKKLSGLVSPVVLASLLICIVIHTTRAFADDSDTLWISLDDCLSKALGNSPAAGEMRLDSLASAGRWQAVRGKRYPQLRLTGQLPDWEKSVVYDVRYDPYLDADVYSRIPSDNQRWLSTLNLDQDLPWGATLNLSSTLYKLRYVTDLQDTTITVNQYSWSQRALISQPLLEGNPIGRQRRIGEIEWSNALIDNELQRRTIRYNTIQQFFGLVSAYGQSDIAKQDYDQGVQSVEITQRKFNAGLVPEVDLLRIKVDVARREASWRQAQASVADAMDNLRLQLGLKFDRPLAPRVDIANMGHRSPDSIKTQGEPLESVRGKLNLDQLELETRAQVISQRISATLDLFYELDSRQETFSKLSTDGDRNFGLTLHIDFPILGFGTTGGTVQALKANLERQRLDLTVRNAQLAVDMRQGMRNAELAREQIRIADAALDLAEKSFDITNNRFESGLINSKDLIDAQLELTRTRREALTARIDYELALAHLERIAPADKDALRIK